MSQKNKVVILISVVMLLGIVALVSYLNQPQPPLPNSKAYAQEINERMEEKLVVQEAEKNSLSNQMPLPNPEAYARETNEWMAEKLAAQKTEKNWFSKVINKASNLVQWIILASFQEAELKRIDFYGRVIDQDNNPIPGVTVTYDLGGLYLAPGTGFGEITTNEKGEFNIDDGKGLDVYFRNMSKPGYQYQFSNDGGTSVPFYTINNSEWDKTSKKNLYIFKLWRIDRYPEIDRGEDRIVSENTSLFHTINFMRYNDNIFKKGRVDGDIQITVEKSKIEKAFIKIEVVNGGLQECDELYPFRAPEEGYLPSLEYKIPYNTQFKDFDDIERKFYFRSRNGELYGYLEMKIIPEFQEGYAIFVDYVTNWEKTRDLLVKE